MNNKPIADSEKAVVEELKRKARKKRVIKALNNWQLYVMVLPAILYIILFAYKPMYGIQIAFRDFSFRDGITGSEWVGFAQFEKLKCV